MKLYAAIWTLSLGLVLFRQAEVSAQNVSRITVELTEGADLSVTVESVKGVPYEPGDGVPIKFSQFSSTQVWREGDFFVLQHKFETDEDALPFGQGLVVKNNALVAAPSERKDGIGPAITISHPRRFRPPFSFDIDVVRHGTSTRSELSHGGRSINFNLRIGVNAHAFVSVQTVDTSYREGQLTVSWRAEGDPSLKEIAKVPLKSGVTKVRRKLNGLPEASVLIAPYFVVRGDVAQIKQMRLSGELAPTFGLGFEGKAGRVTVRNVSPGSPAGEANILEGDRIVSIDGITVRDTQKTLDLISSGSVGRKLTMEIQSDGKTRSVELIGE